MNRINKKKLNFFFFKEKLLVIVYSYALLQSNTDLPPKTTLESIVPPYHVPICHYLQLQIF